MSEASKRGPFLSVMAVLYSILTLSNFTKAYQYMSNPTVGGIVIFGVRFESVVSNLILGPLMGLVVGSYAYGLWKQRSWLVPLSIAYAFYVPLNLVLFWYRQTGPDVPSLGFLLPYLTIAFTGSIGTALYLAHHPEKLAHG
ncbi:MAG: hypothetical protein HY270_10170 [Deltaproteobacteria bacterium]|nr:hypothetical protein [Deltaproteobacteria bacterium]